MKNHANGFNYAAAFVVLVWAAAPALASDPTNLVATGRADRQLAVHWEANGNTSFTVDYLGPEWFGGADATCASQIPTHNNQLVTAGDEVTIGALQPSTWYHIHVHAIGPGEAGRTNDIIVRTRADGSPFEPLTSGSSDYSICGGNGFTDAVLTSARSVIRGGHITELRSRIDALRTRFQLTAFAWTDPNLTAAASEVRAVHLTELRTALSQAYAAAHETPPTYTDSALETAMTIKRVHVTELRSAVVALE
jgi:hypothetical protein